MIGAFALASVALAIVPLETTLPPVWTPERVMIDAGHGAKGNAGTEDAFCEREQVHTKRTQDDAAAWLRARPGIDVRVTRASAKELSYQSRIDAMKKWRPHAVVSIHSDARAVDGWWRDAHTGCWRSRGGNGFAILYSDEGAAALVASRLALGSALADAMIEAGFAPYDGVDYLGLYGFVRVGVFVDRHAKGQRVMMLRKTMVPFVIVETHQAVDEDEARLWAQPATQAAFASAIYRAVVASRSPRHAVERGKSP